MKTMAKNEFRQMVGKELIMLSKMLISNAEKVNHCTKNDIALCLEKLAFIIRQEDF